MILSWPGIAFLLGGTLVGMVFGILPGLGGAQVLALLLPMTFSLHPEYAIIMLIGAAGAVPTAGSVTGILLNTPGSSQNVASTFDGYPLAKQGKAGYAIGAAAMASLLGALVGAFVLVLILPLGRQVVLAFSYPEYFMVTIMGLCLVAILGEGTMWKGIMSAGLGLMLAFVGADPIEGIVRYGLGMDYLYDGVKLVPVMIGMFAISEALSLLLGKKSVADERIEVGMGGVWKGALAVFQNFGSFLRGAVTGTLIGIIPGVGGAVANLAAYGQAKATAKDKDSFGKGDIRGVIAPEAANNAKDGGALVPTLIFGIPGSLDMAILIGALMVFGITPGPRLMLDNPGIIMVLVSTLVLGNVLAGLVILGWAPLLARVTSIKSSFIAPTVLVLGLLGSYATYGHFGDMVVALIFGIVGYCFQAFGFSRVALIIALVLGGLIEKNFYQSMLVFGIEGSLTRPIAFVTLLLTIAMLAFPFVRSTLARRVLGAASREGSKGA